MFSEKLKFKNKTANSVYHRVSEELNETIVSAF